MDRSTRELVSLPHSPTSLTLHCTFVNHSHALQHQWGLGGNSTDSRNNSSCSHNSNYRHHTGSGRCPQQHDSTSCGLFVAEFCRMLCGADADITTEATSVRLQQVETKQTREWLGRLCRTLEVPLSDPCYKRSPHKRQRSDTVAACKMQDGSRCCDRSLIHCDHDDSISFMLAAVWPLSTLSLAWFMILYTMPCFDESWVAMTVPRRCLLPP